MTQAAGTTATVLILNPYATASASITDIGSYDVATDVDLRLNISAALGKNSWGVRYEIQWPKPKPKHEKKYWKSNFDLIHGKPSLREARGE